MHQQRMLKHLCVPLPEYGRGTRMGNGRGGGVGAGGGRARRALVENRGHRPVVERAEASDERAGAVLTLVAVD